MKQRRSLYAMLGIILALTGPGYAQTYVPEGSEGYVMKIKPEVEIKAYAFDLRDVQLKESIFMDAMKADVAYLKELDPDRFLSQFRAHAGLKPKAEKYGGWEDAGLAGHSLGHYLSACSMYYALSKDSVFLNRVNYIVSELAACQKARGTGYVGAVPNEDMVFYKVALGEIKTGGFDLNGAWAPWYTLHKIMAGLMDAYIYCGNQQAMDVDEKIADWTYRVLRGLTEAERQKMLRCEYGGMSEALVNLYALTGKEEYLDLSYKFHDDFVLDSLEARVNVIPGKHSNTNIPKVIGSIRRYELTGNKKDSIAAGFFWNTVIHHHTYAPGGNGNYEYFGPDDVLPLTDNTMETCSTYNMLKLTRHLFALHPDADYMDYYERALYNHILSSQNRKDGMSCYFMPLRMGTKKEFSDKFNTFTCCVGTTMENHVKYEGAIYSHGSDGSLFVNLFIPSVLEWKEKNARITLDTRFPYSDQFSLIIQTSKKQNFPVRIRKPYWVDGDITVKVNRKMLENPVVDKDGYIVIARNWKNNDRITVTFPMGIHAMSLPDNQKRYAFFYGPIILAGDLGKNEPNPMDGTPVFLSGNESPAQWIKAKDINNLTFTSTGTGEPHDVTFKPLYDFTDDYYSVYWDVFSPLEWEKQKKIYKEQERQARELEERTVDLFRVGEMQPERDHHFSGENIFTGEEHTRKFRMAHGGGQMHFTMKVDENLPNQIVLTYWGMDNRYRNFDILVDSVKIATVDLNKYKKSQFYDIPYDIPLELTKGKKAVEVVLQAHPKQQAGPVYGIRMVKVE